MATTLYLIRHGETAGDGVKRYKGSIDVPLSPRGHAQAARLAAWMRTWTPALDAIYSSPLQRARDTARPLADAYGRDIATHPSFRERSFGEWEGMSFEEIRAAWPDAFTAWASDPLNHAPVGGESTRAVRDRVVPAIEGIVARHAGERIAVVAHGGVNRVVLCHALGAPMENIFRVEQDFGCLSVIEYHDTHPVVTMMNRLPGEDRAAPGQRVSG